jgi:hypothetical protein
MKKEAKTEVFEFKLLSNISENQFLEAAKALINMVTSNDLADDIKLYKGPDNLWVSITQYNEKRSEDDNYWQMLETKPEFQQYMAMIDNKSIKDTFLEQVL